MEEQQIQDFVRRTSHDENLRKELTNNIESVVAREGFSSVVAKVVMSMIPQLAMGEEIGPSLRCWIEGPKPK